MSMKDKQEVIKAVEEGLELSPGSLNETSVAEDVDTWDSIGQLSIIVILDKLYDGQIAKINEMSEADSMDKIFSLLKQHDLLK